MLEYVIEDVFEDNNYDETVIIINEPYLSGRKIKKCKIKQIEDYYVLNEFDGMDSLELILTNKKNKHEKIYFYLDPSKKHKNRCCITFQTKYLTISSKKWNEKICDKFVTIETIGLYVGNNHANGDVYFRIKIPLDSKLIKFMEKIKFRTSVSKNIKSFKDVFISGLK